MYVAIGLNVCAAIAFYWVPESPRYLYGINDLEKCADVLEYIARMNGIKDYERPKFEPEYDIHIGAEEIDVSADVAGPDMQGKNQQFDSLLSVRRSGNDAGRATQNENKMTFERSNEEVIGRYRTVAKAAEDRDPTSGTSTSINRLTKRETIALMHATVTGIRQTTNWWVIGADRTQSIAIDEMFSKNSDKDMLDHKRGTVTLRNA